MVDNSAEVVNTQSVDNQVSEPTVAPVQSEPMSAQVGLSQSEVNALVGAAKQKGYQKALKDAAQFSGSSQTSIQSPIGGTPTSAGQTQAPLDVDKIIENKMSAYIEQQQEAQQQATEQAEAQRIVSELAPKFEDAKSRYDDFDVAIGNATPALTNAPQLIKFANSVDNSGDVLYDLAKNPMKIASLGMLPENLAMAEIQKLANSIKKNRESVAQPKANSPLSQLSRSPVGMDSGGERTVADFKNIYRG